MATGSSKKPAACGPSQVKSSRLSTVGYESNRPSLSIMLKRQSVRREDRNPSRIIARVSSFPSWPLPGVMPKGVWSSLGAAVEMGEVAVQTVCRRLDTPLSAVAFCFSASHHISYSIWFRPSPVHASPYHVCCNRPAASAPAAARSARPLRRSRHRLVRPRDPLLGGLERYLLKDDCTFGRNWRKRLSHLDLRGCAH